MQNPLKGTLGRRELLSAFGAFAASEMLLTDVVAQENNPAANVADKASDVKITGMVTHRVAHKGVPGSADQSGRHRLGEVSALQPDAAEALCKSLYELLDNENPTRIEHLWQKIYRAHRDMRGGPFMTHTLAGIDMALWDITGKLWGRSRVPAAGWAVPRQNPRLSQCQSAQGAAGGRLRSRGHSSRNRPDGQYGEAGPGASRPRRRRHVRRAIAPFLPRRSSSLPRRSRRMTCCSSKKWPYRGILRSSNA